ncbi:BTB/POZ domain-containing protein 19 isoform 1-T1 [Ara ararauna]
MGFTTRRPFLPAAAFAAALLLRARFPEQWAVSYSGLLPAGSPGRPASRLPPACLPPSSALLPKAAHGWSLLRAVAAGRSGRLHRRPPHPGQQPPVQALEVLTSSVEYGLQDLCKLCIKFIKDTLSVEQVCEALQAAVTYGQTDLQQHCLAFIEGCTAAVVRTQGFHELSDVVLARVLRSDHLAVDELDLVQAVREWAHVSSAVLERPVSEVAALPVQELRLPLLAPSELAMLESQNQRDLLIPAESIAAAWRSHALKKGSGVPSHLCRPRRGTRPRDHHRHLDPHAK